MSRSRDVLRPEDRLVIEVPRLGSFVPLVTRPRMLAMRTVIARRA